MVKTSDRNFVSTRNACKLCAPFGACWAFFGVQGCVPLLHGSQGCSTYVRRYMIGHFREPVDIASTNFHESAAIFGGRDNLFAALDNVARQYQPAAIGIATTCLAETIGDDVKMFLDQYRRERADQSLPELIQVSTASYRGTHEEGFAATVLAIVDALCDPSPGPRNIGRVNIFSGMISPADIRWLDRVTREMGLEATILPDYSDTLDGTAWEAYRRLGEGGTPLEAIRTMGAAAGSVEFTSTRTADQCASTLLLERTGCPACRMPLPVGVKATDRFFDELKRLTGKDAPAACTAGRGRLIDAYVDGHKYILGKRVGIYGEQDLVAALAGFCAEIGLAVVVCASGGKTGRLAGQVASVTGELNDRPGVVEGADFVEIESDLRSAGVDLLIGNSNGAKIARALNVPLVRLGMPVHDRFGAQRLSMLGYTGTQQLYDRIVNELLEVKQESNDVGYTHM